MKYQKFIFDHYDFNVADRRLELHYSFDDKVSFIEVYELNFEFMANYDQKALDKALLGLFVMAGVSYFKADLPSEIELRQGELSQAQADFFAKTYKLGLGEFALRNKVPLVEVKFPVADVASSAVTIPDLLGSLVAVGGGKDSLVTIELMEGSDAPVSTWMVNHSDQLEPLLAKVGLPHLPIIRKIAPELVRLNQEGAYNGHVPISAILNFVGVVCAILTGRANVVMSNEWSAGEGNAEYEGVMVNHQYSKGFEYEREFNAYVKEFITPSMEVFSLLRPLSELKIAETFCGKYLEKYAGSFSSCNRNFHLDDHGKLFWCGECPKCAFVYLIFAPFVKKDRLVELFGGKNLFVDEKLFSTYDELLGLAGHKPFECVGEIDECRQAVVLARATREYPELERYNFAKPKFDYKESHPSIIPPEFADLLENEVRSTEYGF